MMLREKYATEIDAILSRYTSRRSATLPLLYVAQDEYGCLSEDTIDEVADILGLPPSDVFEVVGFYTLYYRKPVGTWMVQVCDDVPCCYCGAEELIAALKETLGINEEETTQDGMFTLQRVKCLAACQHAPVVQANLAYIYDVTADKVDGLLHDLRARAQRGEVFKLSGSDAEDFELNADGSLRQIERRMGDMPVEQ